MNEPQHLEQCFQLMETLIDCRQRPIRQPLDAMREATSMLHLDVLLLVYEFARTCAGQVLEIGSYVGGSTIAAAQGIRDSGTRKKLITIEPGGSVAEHQLETPDILRDLKQNLARYGVAEMVTLLEGRSSDAEVIAAVERDLDSDKVGFLLLDADGAVKRDLDCYAPRLGAGCWVVIDDYFGPSENDKVAPTRAETDAFVRAGKLLPLGFFGWGTWIGKWKV